MPLNIISPVQAVKEVVFVPPYLISITFISSKNIFVKWAKQN